MNITEARSESPATDEFGMELQTDFACINAAIGAAPKFMRELVSEASRIAQARGVVMRYPSYYDHINDRLINCAGSKRPSRDALQMRYQQFRIRKQKPA